MVADAQIDRRNGQRRLGTEERQSERAENAFVSRIEILTTKLLTSTQA